MAKIAGLILVIVFVFLVAFKPFHINETEHRFPYVVTALIQSFSSAVVFMLVLGGFNAVINEKMEESWTVLKEIGLLSAVFFCMGVGNFFIRNLIYNNPNNLSFHYFFEEVSHTFLVGVLLTIIFTFTNTERLIRLHKKFATQVTKDPPLITPKEAEVFIETNNESDSFTLSIAHFLYAKADGNYVEFYCTDTGHLQKKVCRITLTQVEKQLKDFSAIVRTHRSYLVHTKRIQNVEGNAQGLQLTMRAVPEKIPVSRSQIPAFRKVMNG
ncbi:LytR/AlgR family response regulator transcription factor [Zunongwangia sp. H14]|uniref:LytR/AlgR family response regulator transcription factor n=1 Tax=Zunongwangia sp. H14 TaxID=3240792 RepID=UPI00356B447D